VRAKVCTSSTHTAIFAARQRSITVRKKTGGAV
jgi:hypothetical protein